MNIEPVEVLLVDDSEDDLVLVQEALAEAKLLNVLNVARDGEQALAYLRREGKYKDAQMPGLILLDINMPKKNGFEVLEELKADPALQHIPVVMLTVSDRDADVAKAYAKGACSYVMKPVDSNKLREVVQGFELYWTLVSRIPSHRR